jgi:HAD superfamily hydrolase (TIGR01549 family)
MDGTLTHSHLDYELIRSEMGIPHGRPILEHMQHMDASECLQAKEILRRHENRAAEECLLADGAHRLLDELTNRGLRTALLTRNSAESVRTVLRRFGLSFDICVSREDATPKPSPEPVWHIATSLGLQPRQLLVVGDYLFDVQAGHAAGALTAFLRTDRPIVPPEEADFVIDHIGGVLDLLPDSLAEV